MKKNWKTKKVIHYIGSIILFAIIHYGAVRIGLQMAFVQQNISPVWPPSGIAIAVLLIFGPRMWPGIALSVFIGSLFDGSVPVIAFGLALANTIESLIAVWLLRKVKFDSSITRVYDVISLAFSCGIATIISASLGTATIFFIQKDISSFNLLWLTWWIGNFLGCFVVAPFILSWRQIKFHTINKKKFLEGFLLILVIVIVTWFVFSSQYESIAINQAIIYVVFPFIILLALRAEMPGVTVAIVIVTSIAVFKSINNSGPFNSNSINDNLILLQTFMGVITFISLILAATSTERKISEESQNQKIQGLAALNSSSEVILDNLGKKNIYQTICQLVIEKFMASIAWIESMGDGKSLPVPIAYASSESNFEDSEINDFLKNVQIRSAIKQAEVQGQPYILDQVNPSSELPGIINGSMIALPLRYSDKAIGMLCVYNSKPNIFIGDQIILLESYANLTSIAFQNNLLFEKVQTGNEQLHSLSHRLMDVQEAERLRLSQELHDESGQILAILMVHLGLMERNVDQPELIHDHIKSLREIVKSVLDNLHKIAVNLRPASLDKLGLVVGLRQYVQEFLPQKGVDVQIEVVGEEIGRFTEEIETALFRIVQESLSNVILHANATQVDILISKRSGSIKVMIEDNGQGFETNTLIQSDQLGIFGIRERILVLGGEFQIESTKGKGTTVVVEIPYENKSDNRG